MQPKQTVKSWIKERKWINPYWFKLEQHPGRIFMEQDLFEGLNNFREVIAVHDDLICEFGSGSGEHLLQLAKKNPNSAIIGFELRFKRVVRTIEKAKKEKLENVYVICGYAQNVNNFFEPQTVKEVYVNFPDPWEKKPKNRLLNVDYLNSLHRLLNNNGTLNFKTDHLEYFQSVLALFADMDKYKINFATEDLHGLLPKEEIMLTEFEKLFLGQSLKINALQAKKILC